MHEFSTYIYVLNSCTIFPLCAYLCAYIYAHKLLLTLGKLECEIDGKKCVCF